MYDRRVQRSVGTGSSTSALGAPGKRTLTQRHIQRKPADGYSDAYGPNGARAGSGHQLTPDQYQGMIGKHDQVPELKAASAWNDQATPRNGAVLTDADLLEVLRAAHKGAFGALVAEHDEKEHERRLGKLHQYLEQTNAAAATMMLDTVEAYSLFIAHSAGETGMSVMTEGQKNRFDDDPAHLDINKTDPNGPLRYRTQANAKDTVDPTGHGANVPDHFEKTFIGRGPIQVTHDYNYVQTIVYLEERARQLRGEGNDAEADKCQRAADAIKADPTQAANPEHAFLFSMAMMHHSKMVKRSGGIGSTADAKELGAGFTGGFKDPQVVKKSDAYKKCHELLSAKVAGERGPIG